MPPRTKGRSYWDWELFAHRWLTLLVAGVGCLFVAVQLYWNYSCRFHGMLCERSLAAPSAGTLSSNAEAVRVQLTENKNKKDLLGFELSPRDHWFQTDRVDIAVRWKGGDTRVIDSIPVQDLGSVALYSNPDASVAMASTVSKERLSSDTSRVHATVMLYVLGTFLAKREFSIECVGYTILDPRLRAFNMSYAGTPNRIQFDVSSSCNEISIDGRRSVYLKGPQTLSEKYQYWHLRGETISIDLDDNFQVKEISVAGELRAEKERQDQEAKREGRLAACLENLIKTATKEPRLYLCSYNTRFSANDWFMDYRIHRITDGDHQQIADDGCLGEPQVEEDGYKGNYIIVACRRKKVDEKNQDENSTSYSINLYSLDAGAPVTFAVRCNCIDLEIRDFKVSDAKREIFFEMLTSAEMVRVQDRPFELKRDKGLGPKDRSIAVLLVEYGTNRRYLRHDLATRIQ